MSEDGSRESLQAYDDQVKLALHGLNFFLMQC
jgi:hypothetical protein